MSYTPGRFVWFEHLSNDVTQARDFYDKLFGWNTEMMAVPGGTPYAMIHNGEAGIGGYVQAPSGSPSRWMSYLSVSDVDSAYKASLAAGAKSLVAPMDYGAAGRSATIADPTGGVLSLWRGAQGDPADPETTPPGGWIWNELSTQDEKMALAFYEKVFAFGHDEMPMQQGSYFVLKQGEKGRAGLYKSMDAAMPTMWTPYVCVDDCDAISAKATSLGATVCVAPTDVPHVGRLAMFNDPQGASIAVLKPDPNMG